MSWSGAEIFALAGKAARGAGAPPEQAARFGKACVCHLMAERNPQDVLGALEALPNGPILELPLAIDAIAAEADPIADRTLDVGQGPLLQSYVDALPFAAQLCLSSDGGARLVINVAEAGPRKTPRRITRCEDLIARCEVLAARILVPDTAQSRALGAGAGLTDND